MKYKATLISGKSFTLLVPNPENPRQPTEHLFKADEPKIVSEQIKMLLEEEAVDEVGIKQGSKNTTENRCKFEFAVVREREAPAKAASTAA